MSDGEPLHEGDGVLLFSKAANGFIFSPPPLDPKLSTVSIYSIDPAFIKVYFFVIQPHTFLTEPKESNVPRGEKKKLVYGRKVLLYHAVSKLYLAFTGSDSTSVVTSKSRLEMASLVSSSLDEIPTVFRILPSDPDKPIGQQIYLEDSVRLEISGEQGQKFQALCVPNLLNLKYMGYDLKTASYGSDFVLHSQSTWQADPKMTKTDDISNGQESVDGGEVHVPMGSISKPSIGNFSWIEETDEETSKKFCALLGAFIVLKELLEKLKTISSIKDKKTRKSMVAIPTDILNALAKWTEKSSDNSTIEKWPDMWRGIEGIELVLEFLRKPIIEYTPTRIQESLCIVLKNYIKFASEKSQVYLISKEELIDTLFSLMEQNVGAEDVLSALIKCKSFGTKQKDKVLQKFLRRQKSKVMKLEFQFLKCLGALCMSRGRPDTRIQKKLLDGVIIPDHKKNLFFKIVEREGNSLEIVPPQGVGDNLEHIKQLLVLQLKFYTAVCQGVNLYCIEKMTEVKDQPLLTYNAASLSVDRYKRSPAVQSAFYGYLVATLVDKNVQESGTDNFWYIYLWTKFCNDSFQPIKLSSIGDTHEIISDKDEMIKIQNDIQQSLETKDWHVDLNEGQEELMMKKLCVLETLVSFGFYLTGTDNKEGKAEAMSEGQSPHMVISSPDVVIGVLIDILDYEPSHDADMARVTRLKSKVINVLNLFLYQTYHLGIARLIYGYSHFKEKLLSDSNEGHQSVIQVEHNSEVQQARACNRLKWVLFEQRPDPPLTSFPKQIGLYDYELLNIYSDKPIKIVSQLIGFLGSEDDGLCLTAAKLLFDLFRGESYLFDKSEKSLIVTDTSLYSQMINYATYNGEGGKAVLRLMQGKGADSETKPFVDEVANQIISKAGNLPETDETAPRDETLVNARKQLIVLTTGLFNTLLNYVLKYSVTDDSSQEELVLKVCEALQATTRGNNQVKEVVLSQFDDLLNAKQGISAVANLLTEVLTDNIDACRRLSHESVRKMFKMITSDADHYEFVPTIKAWMKVSKSSPQLMKMHQRSVCELCKQFFEDNYKTDWNPKTSAQEMLQNKDSDKFILFAHMLGVCVEGIHKYCEDIVRGMFEFSTLAEIIVDDKLPLDKRLPFIILLNEGYLKTETEALKSVLDFARDRSLWAHVEYVTKLVSVNMSKKLTSIDKWTTACQKIKLKILFSQHMTHIYWRQHRILSTDMHKREETGSVEATKGLPLSILYQYLIEGLLPCLSTFAEEYKSLWELYEDRFTEESRSVRKENIHVLKTFGEKLESLIKTFPGVFVSNQDQLVYWESTLKPIMCIDKDSKVAYSLGIKPDGNETRVKILTEGLAKEESVNIGFKTFLKSFKELIHCKNVNDNQDGLYPTGPGYQLLLKNLFPPEVKNSRNVEYLVKLLKILHKRIQQSQSSKETSSLNQLVVNIIQVLSGVLHREASAELGTVDVSGGEQQLSLCNWQRIFMDTNVHTNCVLHMDNSDNEIVLQILDLLRLATLHANLKAQDLVYSEISSRDSVFCGRVYMLLKHVISTVKETWTKNGGNLLPLEELEQQEPILVTNNLANKGTLTFQSLDSGIRVGSIVLDCISALCDGHQRKIQCFFLVQDQSFKHCIVKKIAVLLEVLTEEYNDKVFTFITPKRVYSYLDLIQKAIQALIEITAGNYSNQEAVFKCQITDTITKYLLVKIHVINKPKYTQGWSDEEKIILQGMMKTLSVKAIDLLQVLLEETDDGSLPLITNFSDDVNLDGIITTMLTFKDIGAYHILRLVADTRVISVDTLVFGGKMRKWSNEEKDLWKDFKARSRCIEVLYRPVVDDDKKILTKVYFDFDPLDEVREDYKETVTNAISGESQEENLTEFNEWGRFIRKNTKYKYKYFLNNGKMIWMFRAMYETSGPRHCLLILLTVLLNLLVLSVTAAPSPLSSGNSSFFDPNLPEWHFPILLPILGILHIILSVWMVVEFIVTEGPNFTKDVIFVTISQNLWKYLKRWVSQQEMFQSICPKDWRLRHNRRDLLTNTSGKQVSEDLYYNDEKEAGYFKVDIFGFQSMYRFVFLICSIAAIPLHGYPYCICLFYVFLDVDVVQYILTALSRSCKQLVFIGLIAGGILLVFGVVAFVFVQDHFNETDDNPLFCNSLWQCFISVSREGLLGTLGPAIPFKENPSYTYYALRTILLDLPFFLIVTTIVLSIVIAVLIDRFSDLREERDKVERKKMKACFICGIDTGKFERERKGFRHHVKEDHNKWNYIYYLIYLDRKCRNDLTALEKQIADDNKIDKRYGKTDHYPIGKAKGIKERMK